MDIPLKTYTTEKKRTLKSIQDCAALPPSRPAKDRLGSQNKPILHVEPDKIVIDKLHLLLRIGDILVRNIVHEVIHADKLANRHSARSAQKNTNMNQLLLFINMYCKVNFRVWEKRDQSGRPSGKYEWTSLMGSDMKKVLSLLPDKFPELKIWKVSD